MLEIEIMGYLEWNAKRRENIRGSGALSLSLFVALHR